MSLRTYLLLTIRYMNPFFTRHPYPLDWKTWHYWKRGIRLGLPYPILFIFFLFILTLLILPIKDYILIAESKEINLMMAKLYLFFPSTLLAYLFAKKFMPPPGHANQYELKTLDAQLLMIITALVFYLIFS